MQSVEHFSARESIDHVRYRLIKGVVSRVKGVG